MRHYIESISFQINNEPFNLKLEGKNLIISGNNGSGKTKLIERIFSFVEESIKSHNPYTLEQAENDLKSTENNLQRTQKGHGNYDYFINDIEKIKIRIKAFNEFNITFNDLMI
ncbi:hypothetical protein ACXDJ6_002418 [Klebsiella variicola]